MIIIRGTSPNQAYWQLLRLAVGNSFRQSSSRLGSCIELGHVLVELYRGERLCLLKERGFNPVFALVEAGWMLAGRNDLGPLQTVISDYGKYSDDGRTLNGAYGHRLRAYFGLDQIEEAIHQLRSQPSTRRVALSLYGANDLGKDSVNIPCNTQLIVRIEDCQLAMTVINRSNDLWLGVPYNWFTFHALQQYLAMEVGIPAGRQRHLSTCMHLYESDLASAQRVVTANTAESIQDVELHAISFDFAELLADIDALSTARLDDIHSPNLASFFQRYRASRDHVPANLNPNVQSRHALDIALDNWIKVRRQSKETSVSMSNNSPAEVKAPASVALQRWVFSDGRDQVLEGLRVAAANLRDQLPTLLERGMPPGAHVSIEDAASEDMALYVALEVLLGCLDPLVVQSSIGESFRQRLNELGTSLGLSPIQLRGRELPESELRGIFRHVLG